MTSSDIRVVVHGGVRSLGDRRWWLVIVGSYALSRVTSTLIMLAVIVAARPGSRIGAHATLTDVLTAWDGQWYWLIARSGYPMHLPVAATGFAQNAWAFLPVYPFLALVLALGSAAAWPVAAATLSVVSGGVAAVLLGALVRPRVGSRGAVVTATLFSFSPVAFLLQSTYAEALSLALTFGVLLLVDRGRYLAAIAPVVVLAFTRPGVQAIALFVLSAAACQLRDARRARLPLSRSVLVRAGALVAVAAASGWAWPALAAFVTGSPNAYLATELAWRSAWTGSTDFVPVVSWATAAAFWLGTPAGPIALALAAGAWVLFLLSERARRAGRTVRLWAVSWTVYLLLVFFPQSSTFRLLMPLAPLGAVFARSRNRVVVALVLASIALQGIWLFCVDGYWQHFWTVP